MLIRIVLGCSGCRQQVVKRVTLFHNAHCLGRLAKILGMAGMSGMPAWLTGNPTDSQRTS